MLEGQRDARWAGARRWVALPAAFASIATSACGSSSQCTCPDQAIYVRIPDALASSVIDVTPSGTACASAPPQCIANGGAGGACTIYRIAPTIDGPCHVDVDFAMGGPRFSADARVVHNGGCCGGFVTDPPSASDIDVPDATDAGARDSAIADAGGGG